jgi:hypothetical protein
MRLFLLPLHPTHKCRPRDQYDQCGDDEDQVWIKQLWLLSWLAEPSVAELLSRLTDYFEIANRTEQYIRPKTVT